jgi:hypothetical protein
VSLLVGTKGPMARVQPIWAGKKVVVIATGPSLTREQIALIPEGVPRIAVNDAYHWAPNADLVYFADKKWHDWQVKGIPKPGLGLAKEEVQAAWRAFPGQRCSVDVGNGTPIYPAGIFMLRNARQRGISSDPEAICTGSNSGYQAINIAILAGAKRVVLIGFDCRDVGAKSHFFGDHEDKTKPPYATVTDSFKSMAGAAENLGIEILNATPGTALDCFEKVELGAGLFADP